MPNSLVVNPRFSLVRMLVAVTLAPGITAPVASVTVPTMAPKILWAAAGWRRSGTDSILLNTKINVIPS